MNKNSTDEVKKPEIFLKDVKVQNEKSNDIPFEPNRVNKTTENQSNDLDLFNNEPPSETVDHQIDITEIEQENKDIDEKVLEIPAFLRRQAN